MLRSLVRPRNLRALLAFAVFTIQAILAVLFFWNLGSGGSDSLVLSGTGVCLELAKRHCWRLVHSREKGWAVIGMALVFSAVSGVSALAYTWSVSEAGAEQARALELRSTQLRNQLKALDDESLALGSKLAALPADWVTHSLRYSARLAEISKDRQAVEKELGGLGRLGSGEVRSGLYPFIRWAESIGLQWGAVYLGFLTLISILLEVAVVQTTTASLPRSGTNPQDLELLIIQTAFVAPDKPLLSRRKITSRLKVSESEVRKVLGKLTSMELAGSRPGSKGLYPSQGFQESVSRWGKGGEKVEFAR